jgi:hypothetical protein
MAGCISLAEQGSHDPTDTLQSYAQVCHKRGLPTTFLPTSEIAAGEVLMFRCENKNCSLYGQPVYTDRANCLGCEKPLESTPNPEANTVLRSIVDWCKRWMGEPHPR